MGGARAMRRAARVDDNQAELVKQLRKAGATVQHLHTQGRGCPDLLVGWRGLNLLFEVKDPNKPPSARLLTDDEREWHAKWRGQVHVIETAEEALEVMGRD